MAGELLTIPEKQWLLAMSRGRLTKAAAEKYIPSSVLDSLIDKRLVRWVLGLVELSPIGMVTAEDMRAGRL